MIQEGSAMKKVLVIGCPGSGKTTLSIKLADKLALPLVHLDTLFWRDNRKQTSRDEFDELLMKELVKPRWIIDGNFSRTIPTRLKYCDTIIYLDFPRLVCLRSVLKRCLVSYGKSRPDMGGNCPEKVDFTFLKSVWQFNRTQRNKTYSLLKEQHDTKIIILHSRKQVKEFLRSI